MGGFSSASVPLAAYGFVQDFRGVLSAEGVPIGPAARKTRLPLLIDDPLQMIPKRPAFLFLDEVSTPELPVFGLATGMRSGAGGLTRGLVDSTCVDGGTLLAGLRVFVRLIRRLSNELPIDLELTSDGAWLWHRGLSAPADGSRPGILQLELYILGILLSVVRRYLGDGWTPERLHVQAARVPDELSRCLGFPVVETGETCLRVWIPTAALGASVCRGWRSDRSAVTEAPPNDLVGGLREAMIGYFSDPACDFTLALAAEIARLSERSLQRRLAARGLSFRGLMAEAMVESAKHHLCDETLTVGDIALTHGYSDASHFSRAFSRIAGMTPGAYRRMDGEPATMVAAAR